eukprot:GFUD01045381.1.p1 GENE.GFUD01045381.1~~GFUD01045381.1.p1  ORF type:complete len:827 (+),score=232.40 GFUD01045381.1:107-2482(+)
MEFGLNWLRDNLGPCAVPTVAWQIDPFGHSKEQAKLFAEMGFDGLFFARIDYRDKEVRKTSKALQMWWEGGEEDDVDSTIFTGVFDTHYSNPSGFCWDIICEDEPINDDPRLEEYNVDQKINDFENYVNDHLRYYKDQEHIMFTMGDDFQYQNARMNFKNMDKLIQHMNENSEESGIHVLYSTPSCYLQALQTGSEVYPYKSDDFFPYASGRNSYWTGYFTSRPSIKLQERLGARDLIVTRQLGLLGVRNKGAECAFNLHRAMGLMQHHDAITGTEKQNVAEDYSKRLFKATQECQEENFMKIFERSGIDSSTIDLSQTNCPALNISQCAVSENNENFIISIYNPLSKHVSPYIRVPVPSTEYGVYDDQGERLTVQVNQIPSFIKSIPGRISLAEYELIVRVVGVPPLGYRQVFVQKESGKEQNSISPVLPLEDMPDGLGLQTSNEVQIDLQYYTGSTSGGQPSGAYVFRPDSSGKQPIGEPKYSEILGELVNETIMETGEWGALSIRTYADTDVTEVTWQVGPIPGGKEAVVVYSTNMETDGVFYTDANGRQTIQRKREIINKFDGLKDAELESSNYYPITTRLELRGQDVMTVITDRSQGGSSLEDGQLELMVHRRCLLDDWYGVGESLMEDAFGQGLVARGQHYLLKGSSLAQARILNQEKVLTPQLSFIGTSFALEDWKSLSTDLLTYSALEKDLPASIQLLTLSNWKDTQVLLRFQHIFDKGEDEESIVVDLNNMFKEFDVETLEEMTLAGNQPLKKKENQSYTDGLAFDLNPMQIRTFVANVIWK